MTSAILVNGAAPVHEAQIAALEDRAFQYGDGLFETMRLKAGAVRYLDAHLDRLELGCARLRIDMPEASVLRSEIAKVIASTAEGVVKVIVTRGSGGRGYRAPAAATPTRVVARYPLPARDTGPITLRWCETRLARQPMLAGIKHLNRLEQVLAQSEWNDERIQEGVVLDTEGEVVGGTMSNLFVMREGVLVTPDLRFCGVRGVMRSQVLRSARILGISAVEEPLWPEDLRAAKEVFVTNAVRGLRSVAALGELSWSSFPVAQRLSTELGL